MPKAKKVRLYYLWSESWYGPANRKAMADPPEDDVTFGLYSLKEGEGCYGEMRVEWWNLGHLRPIDMKLVVWDEAFDTLWEFKDVLEKLAHLHDEDRHLSPKEFCELLDSCGFKDATKRKQGD